MRILSDLRSHIVSNLWVQASNQHKGLLHNRRDLLLVSLKTLNKVLLKRVHAIRQNADRVHQVADKHWLENIKLELSVHAANSGSDIVAHDLGADHSQSLSLGWVDLSWHNGRSWLVLWERKLTKTTTWSGTKETDVLGDLKKRAGKGVKGAMGLDDSVVGGKGLELVWRGGEVGAGHLGDLLGNALCEALECVDAGSDGGSSLSKELEVWERGLDTLNAEVELGDVAGELLGEGEWGGILEMGTADLDDSLGLELVDLGLESGTKGLDGWEEALSNLESSGNVHDGWEGVIGGGGHVNVVVWVDRLLGAHISAENLNGAVRDNLVGVHVGLSAGTGLPDGEWEVVNELKGSNLRGGLLDGSSELWICD